ncbi:unnamed protein product [Porites evermanni]|uniref:Fibronectin type-III domain-containing protein n=1 Tax=Porites evermanni TaxID=104178 RepID=A0ABN8M5T5_9CNID|nr:unnamed protein product [Porites evermanni]
MANRLLFCTVEVLLSAVVLWFPVKTSGLHPPSGVNVEAVHGSDFLIISWNYQRDVPYYRILFANPPDEAGPTPVYCLPDNTTCSYCVSNLNTPDVSCITLNSHYTASVSIKLNYEQLVSVRVEACKDLIPEECLQRSEWTNYTIPPGAPSPVRNVHARPLSSKTVEVSWTAPNQTRGTIVLYSVLYKKENDQEMKRVFRNAGKGILTRLSAKTTYKIWVTASTSNREGQRSTLTTVETYADECESSPCKNNGKCHLYGGSYKCLCEEHWEGPRCEIPEGFYMKAKKCLDAGREGNSSLYSNVSLEFCVKECRAISSCKSFEYGLGYNSSGTFVNTLHIKSLGLCKLQHASVSHQPLNDCPYDYYEKKPPVSSSSDVFLSKALFTGHLALMTSVTAILSLSPLALV